MKFPILVYLNRYYINNLGSINKINEFYINFFFLFFVYKVFFYFVPPVALPQVNPLHLHLNCDYLRY